MTITLKLPPSIEKELREEAARRGVEPQEIVLDALTHRLQALASSVPHLDAVEAALLQQINLGFPSDWWGHYEKLKGKRRAETLSPEEQTELIRLSDELEAANVRRMTALVELAERRGTSLDALMGELGLRPPIPEQTMTTRKRGRATCR